MALPYGSLTVPPYGRGMGTIAEISAAETAVETESVDDDITECPPCPLCGVDRPQASPYSGGPYAVARCGHCAAWYLSPRRPEARMREYYLDDAYFEGGTGGYTDYAERERSLRTTFRALLRRLAARGATGGSLLEVGCGYGYFLAEATVYFQSQMGCEMSPQAAERARLYTQDIRLGSIDSIPADRKFDCIVALQVVEHVYNPLEFVTRLRRHLTKSGVMVLAVPDMGGMWRHVLGRRWPSFKYPEHVVFYDQRSLSNLMRDAGLHAPRRISYPHAFPLNEVCAKFGAPRLPGIGGMNVWLPGTTLAMVARAGAEPAA